jgi:hypothetical protein
VIRGQPTALIPHLGLPFRIAERLIQLFRAAKSLLGFITTFQAVEQDSGVQKRRGISRVPRDGGLIFRQRFLGLVIPL